MLAGLWCGLMVWLVNDNLGCYIPRGKYRIHIIKYCTLQCSQPKNARKEFMQIYILLVVHWSLWGQTDYTWRQFSLVPRPPPFFCSSVCVQYNTLKRKSAKNRRGLVSFITWMTSGGHEADIKGRRPTTYMWWTHALVSTRSERNS